MPQLTLSIKYQVNTLAPFSAQDLRDKFLSGLPNEFNGQSISDETINFYIQSALEQLESTLGIKLSRQLITERLDFNQDDWQQWSYTTVTYPIQAPVSLFGYLGQVKQVTYPAEWMSARETTDGKTYDRSLRLIPISGTMSYESTSALMLGTFTPQLSWWRANRNIPNYWKVSYITGFVNDRTPFDILHALGIISAIPVLMIMSDWYAGSKGSGFGVSSKSISIDGLSQSVSNYSQSGIFGARIKQYGEMLFGAGNKPGMFENLRNAYGSGLLMAVC